MFYQQLKKTVESTGSKLSQKDIDNIRNPILQKYEDEGNPYYSTARLWDDGVIDPLDTRMILALGLSTAMNETLKKQISVFSECNHIKS